MTKQITAVAIAQLVTYIIMLPVIAYLLVAHRKPGLLGYLYLFLFCTLQLISAGLQISSSGDTTATILSSVGLSPLLLAWAGIIHEVHTYLPSQSSAKAKLGWVFQLLLHLVTIAGVAILAIGGSELSKDAGTSEYQKDLNHRKVGSIILVIAFLAIAAHAAWVFIRHHSSRNNIAMKLLYSTILALPLVFAKLIYTVVYSFASPGSNTFHALNPSTASIAIRIIFVLLVPALAALILIFGALVSRQLPRHRREKGPQSFEEFQGGELRGIAPK